MSDSAAPPDPGQCSRAAGRDSSMGFDPRLVQIAGEVHAAGGRALLVGGYVRDRLLGLPAKDLDVEVFGLDPPQLEALLARHGRVHAVGRQFGVFKLAGLDADFSLPRRDSKTGPGHTGFSVAFDPGLDFPAAARRRDFTMNSIGLDPLTGERLDPYDGARDIGERILRVTDAEHFAEDPLRGLRAAQFIARFDLSADPELVAQCARLDLSELPGERQLEEFRKLLLKGERPSRGLAFLRDSGLLKHYPELAALIGVDQEPKWHPEGDVWTHTLLVVDAAAALREGDAETLMFAALCHDLGKPACTSRAQGRVRSLGHDRGGVEPTERFLERLRAPRALVRRVAVLVETHLAPALLVAQGASPRAYRRLARKLEADGTDIAMLERVARSDHLGRTTPDALAGRVPWRESFLSAARAALTEMRAPAAAVSGKDLLARGLSPGPELGALLARCREVQDETGWTDPERIIARVLAQRS